MWLYQDKELNLEDIPEKAIGFIYRIKHLTSGKWYIGRKNLFKSAYKQVKGKKKKYMKPTDWKEYWSSSEELQEWVKVEGENAFAKEILFFTESASQTLVGEEYALYISHSLFDSLCLNGNIRSKIFKKWFTDKKNDKFKDIIMNLKI